MHKAITPSGKALGFFHSVKIFTTEELIKTLTDIGFAIEHQWQPGKNKALFVVAKKSEAKIAN